MTYLIYIAAALAEIAGCFAFWAWLKLDKSAFWLLPGVVCLIAFAWLLTLIETEAAGRAYATYGGIYICASLVWMWLAEDMRPDRWDVAGAAICLVGASLILFAPRAASSASPTVLPPWRTCQSAMVTSIGSPGGWIGETDLAERFSPAQAAR